LTTQLCECAVILMQMKELLENWSDEKTVLEMKWLFDNLIIDECAAFFMQMKELLMNWFDKRAVFDNSALINVLYTDARIHEWQSLVSQSCSASWESCVFNHISWACSLSQSSFHTIFHQLLTILEAVSFII